jgi:hypothetical protein
MIELYIELTNDGNENFVCNKEKEPQGIELLPIKYHSSDAANNMAASHQAVARHQQKNC